MKKLTKILFASLALLPLLASCGKACLNVSGTSELILNAGIDASGIQSETKVVYTGTVFRNGQTMGLGICIHEDGDPTLFEPHQPGSGNLKVTCTNNTGTAWSFYNSELKASFTSMYLTSRDDKKKADIYAYAPYMEGVEDMKAIPVDFSKNQDLMVATQNGTADNRNLDPEAAVQIPVNLSFRHLLSRLRLGFKLENAGSNHLIDSIIVKKTGGKSTRIYSGGELNAIDAEGPGAPAGSFNRLDEADSVKVTFGSTSSGDTYGLFSSATSYTYFNFLLYPTDYAADDDLTLVFSIDGFLYEYPIKRDDVLHSDGTTYGFKEGYSYEFKFNFDNYVHLKGITIQSGWTQDSIEEIL